MRIQFGFQSYRHDSLQASAQRMVNCYVEPIKGSDTDALVVSAYGATSFSTPGEGPIRGGKVLNGIPYIVSGSKAYSIDSNGAETELGTIPGSGDVFVDGDETHVMFVNELGDGYYYDGSMHAITDTDFPDAAWLGVIKGYFIVIERDSGQFFISANRDPSSWDALDFASAEEYPDDLVTGIIDHAEFIAFGKESGEVFYVSADPDFPLTRVSSGAFEIGCTQKWTPAKADNSVFFVGHDLLVYRLNGYVPQRISDYVVEQFLQANKDRTLYGYIVEEGGHKHYVISCSAGSHALDISTGVWHERQSYGYDRWRPRLSLYAYSRCLVGMFDSAEIGALDKDTFTELGTTMRLSCTSSPVTDDHQGVEMGRLLLVFQSGVGSVGGVTPQVMIDYSDDRGHTWSNEIWRSIGRHGDYREAAEVNRLGQSNGRVYRYAISDAVRRTLILSTLQADSCGY